MILPNVYAVLNRYHMNTQMKNAVNPLRNCVRGITDHAARLNVRKENNEQ